MWLVVAPLEKSSVQSPSTAKRGRSADPPADLRSSHGKERQRAAIIGMSN